MTTTRRTILGGASTLAASVLTSSASITATSALPIDAELLALRPAWQASLRAFNAALEMLSEVEERTFPRRPDWPLREAFGFDSDSHESYSAACAQVAEAWLLIDDEEGLPAARERQCQTGRANTTIVDQIAATPAHTLRGLAFKVEVSADWEHERAELIESIMDDIVALATRSTIL